MADAAGDGPSVRTGVTAGSNAAAGASTVFFFFAFSGLPPPKRLSMTLPKSFKLRPMSLSMRFVLGRPTVPLT